MQLTPDQKELIKSSLCSVDTVNLYEDMLNDCYPVANIAGLEYDTARALKLIDRIAYDCGLDDYIDSLLQDERYIEIDEVLYCKDEVEALLSDEA